MNTTYITSLIIWILFFIGWYLALDIIGVMIAWSIFIFIFFIVLITKD